MPRQEDDGPYATRVDAEQALKRVAERNAQLDAEDAVDRRAAVTTTPHRNHQSR